MTKERNDEPGADSDGATTPEGLEVHVVDAISVIEAVILSATRRWRQQYDRMMRVRERIRAAKNVDRQLEDDYYSFFMWCYHLKDWLRNDDTVPPAVRAAVEPFVKENRCISVAGDLANGVKHLRLDAPRVDPNMKLSVIQAAFDPDAFQADAFATDDEVVVVVDGDYEPASEIADACVVAWEGFLRSHGLM